MAKNTSILLGEYFNQFIEEQVKSGKYSSASEVVRAALRVFEHEERKKAELIKALRDGENSGYAREYDHASYLNELKEKYGKKD
ncbi:type II toxin-antitoxin system ParD family antitoxin [Phaeocystidibacter luteus]|uniref:Type II toxin-antitoxin system ParD family antitoxin n=1 Tax=Phaeocystidibacter luteus TaxID=911197 RepID=A0A6N6RDR2_9FLAO|nr:type II toxin-antitoxin system ParD family antitoxin [Phaeocystidibacter luteus]KAB2807366.1 type II toxin-antitoxin system ParD family antitoxin [Phaeocystidibacter luteus]